MFLNQSSGKDLSVPERVKHLFVQAYKDAGVGTESNVDRTRYSIANQYKGQT